MVHICRTKPGICDRQYEGFYLSTVTINQAIYRQSLVITADSLHSPWPVNSWLDLSPENLALIFESAPAVVLLGTGPKQHFPEPKIFALFGRSFGSNSQSNHEPR